MQFVRQRRLPLVGLILTVVILILVGLVSALEGQVGEKDLADGGIAYEVFRDENGFLWISDWGAGEIWRVDPAGSYTIFGHLGGVSDAKVDGNGELWWSDNKNNKLGHLVISEAGTEAETWPLTGLVNSTLGLAIAQDGHIWTTDDVEPTVHRFRPEIGDMCAYTVPNGGASSYIVADSGRLWLGDWINNRILALDPVENEFAIWHLPASQEADIIGLAADQNHNIWWADNGQNYLGRLTPTSNRITTYTISPVPSFEPTIVSTAGSLVWTASGNTEFIARLNPANIYIQPTTIVSTPAEAPFVCDENVTSTDITLTVDGPHSFGWSGGFFNRISSSVSNVWLVYQIGYDNDVDTTGSPYGIVSAGPDVFIVDQGRQKLTKLRACFQLSLAHTGDGEDPFGSPGSPDLCPNGEYPSGQTVSITAQPAEGNGILSWQGTDDDDSKGLTNGITMPAEKATVYVNYGISTYLPFIQRN